MDNKIDWINSLRGVACIIVVVAHIIASDSSIGGYASGCGKIAVWLFMLFSGLFLIMPYLDKERNFGWKECRTFYKKKIVRIYPTYLLALLLSVVLGCIEFKDLWKQLVLKEAWGHFWYIPVIIKFYLIAPVFIYILKLFQKFKEHAEISFTILLLCVGTAFTFFFPFYEYIENSISLVWYMPVFVLGMILAMVYKSFSIKNYSGMDWLMIFPVIGIVIVTPVFRKLLWGIEPSGYLQNKYLYISLMWFLILFCCEKGTNFKKFLDKTVLLQKIGDISYEIYLFHFLILNYICSRFDINILVRAFLTICFTIILSLIWNKCWKTIYSKLTVKFILCGIGCIVVLIISLGLIQTKLEVGTERENIDGIKKEETEVESLETWKNNLYVPTMINKIGKDYFIVDCWNNRVIYSDSLERDISEWNTLIEDNYVGGHSICTDGDIMVLDNTDNSQVLVFDKENENYFCKQVISNVNGRPHYVIYDEVYKYFYVIGSTVGKIYVYKNENGFLKWVRTEKIKEIKDSYVRSISIISGKLYTVSGPGKICQYSISKKKFKFEKEYLVPNELVGMNQICKIEDYYYITVNTDSTGSVDGTCIVRTKNLENLNNGDYENLYDEMGFVGQPYFITNFDDKYYITEISADRGNGIKSFQISNGKIENLNTLFYWDTVEQASKDRFEKIESITNTDEKVDLVLFAGQSNMAGKGVSKEAPKVYKGYEFRAISDPTRLYDISEPFGLYENKQNGINDTWENMKVLRKEGKAGMVSAFANEYYSYTGKAIVGVSCSEGATVIDGWLPGNGRYEDLVSRANSAKIFMAEKEGYTIEHTYLVWCQGESDGDAGTTEEEYEAKLNDLFSTLIDNDIVDHCFVIAIGQNGKKNGLYDDIRNAQLNLCNISDNCSLASDEFYNLKDHMIDEYHFDQYSYNLVGKEAGKFCTLYNINN